MLLSNNPLRGSVSVIQEIDCDTSIIMATASENCVFLHWNDGDTTNPRTVITTSDTSYIALFAKQFSVVSVEVNDTTMGTATGGGTYAAGTVVTLTAVPKSGFYFDSWSDGSLDNPRTITLVDDTSVIVFFSDIHDSVFVHDTTVVNIPIHDTSILEVHDTTYINLPYAVHDTTYIDVHDTTYIDVPYAVHDTAYIILTDTVTNTVYDTIINTVLDTIDNYVYDTVMVTDTLWLTEYDTIYITVHDTIVFHDTIVVGVDEVDAINAKVYSNNGQIVVEGADGNMVTLYDVTGRILATRQDDHTPMRFDAPATGTYMIRIGNYPARKVVVIR